MTNIREEIGFCPVCRFRFILGCLQRLTREGAFGDVMKDTIPNYTAIDMRARPCHASEPHPVTCAGKHGCLYLIR